MNRLIQETRPVDDNPGDRSPPRWMAVGGHGEVNRRTGFIHQAVTLGSGPVAHDRVGPGSQERRPDLGLTVRRTREVRVDTDQQLLPVAAADAVADGVDNAPGMPALWTAACVRTATA